MRKFKLHDGKQGAALTIRVTPRSRKTELSGVLEDGTLRVRVATSATDETANTALIAFLASLFGVGKSKIHIVAGEQGLDKIVSILGMTAQEAEEKLQSKLDDILED